MGGVVTIGKGQPTLPRPRRRITVQTRAAWADSWVERTDLEAIAADVKTGALGAASLQLRWRYGDVSSASESTYSGVDPLAYHRHWVRLQMTGDVGMETIWQGQIAASTRNIMGATDDVPRGHQLLTAYNAVHILQRIGIYQSYWEESSAKAGPLDWFPHVNMRGKGGILEGNRSFTDYTDVVTGETSYLYGITVVADLWTARQYVEYLLANFVNGVGRPTFTLGGQTDILDNYTPQIPTRVGETVGTIIGKIIAPEFGIDYVPIANADGWELRVFSLLPAAKAFAGATLPENTFDAVRINAADDRDLVPGGLNVEIDTTHLYDKIRIIGERAVVVFSAYGPFYGGELTSAWTAAQQTGYKAATDAVRASDKYRTTFQELRLADSWLYQSGSAAPRISLDGEFLDGLAAWQTSVRETLPKLPLLEGYDYTTGSPVAPAGSTAEADFRPPLVIARLDDSGTPTYVPVDKLGTTAGELGLELKNMSVRVLENEWGVIVEADPNHSLARDDWAGAAASDFDPTIDGIDWGELIVTLAIRSDTRLALGVDLPPDLAAGDGSVKIVERPGAEFWYMANGTVLDTNGTSLTIYQGAGSVIRNDKDRLALAAAGAIARYLSDRAKASVTFSTLLPVGGLVGSILTLIDSGDLDHIGTPITSVQWNFEANDGMGTTKIMAGHSRR